MSNFTNRNNVNTTSPRRIIKKPTTTPTRARNRDERVEDVKEIKNSNDADIKHSDQQQFVQDDTEAEIQGINLGETKSSLDVRKEVTLVKAYAVLKDEMLETTTKSIASLLFGNRPQLLSHHDHECIVTTKGRRVVVEKLLKRVLIGGDALYDGFKSYFCEQESNLAKVLGETQISDLDMQVYMALKKSSEKQADRPGNDKPRLKFSEHDRQILISSLNRPSFIDPLNDQLLSRLKISIREHNNVVNSSIDNETKVKTFIDTLEQCEENVFEDVCDVLASLEMEHVIEKLDIGKKTKKRTRDSVTDNAQPSVSKKRKCLEPLEDTSMVKRVQTDESHLDKVLQNKIDFTLEGVTEGSIVLQIKPKSQESWNVLMQKCRSGEIKDFIPEVFRNEVENIKAGEHICKLTIYVLTKPPNYEDRKAMIELANPSIISQEIQDLVCEELEITDELLVKLKRKKFVSHTIKEELSGLNKRKERISYVLKQLEKTGKEGYDFLKEYVKEKNDYLYDKIKTEEGIKTIDKTTRTTRLQDSFSRSLERSGIVKERFFSADVMLVVREKASVTPERKRHHSPVFLRKSVMTCPKLINPCCYFDQDKLYEVKHDADIRLESEDSTLKDTWHYASASETNKKSRKSFYEPEEESNSNTKLALRRVASEHNVLDGSYKTQKTDDIPVIQPLRSKQRRSGRRK